MKLGISTASFFNRVPTESSFDLLRRMRVDTTEMFLNTFSEYEKPFAEELSARKGDIEVHSVHCLGTQFEPQLFNLNGRVRADAESLFRKVCCAAFTLGAKYYTFHGPVKLKKRAYNYDYGAICDRLNQLIDIADSCGVNLSYENVHWTYGSDPEYFKQVLSRCPRLYCTLDVKQAVQAGYDPIKFTEVMGNRISTVHLCDVCRDGSTALPGKGKINFEKAVSEVKKYAPAARLFIEAYSGDYEQISELSESYDYIADIMTKIKNK